MEFKKRLQFHPLLTRTLTLVEKTREFKNPRTTIACEQKTKRRRKSRPRKFETYNSRTEPERSRCEGVVIILILVGDGHTFML